MIKPRSTRALCTPDLAHVGGLPRLPGAVHAYEDDVTVCVTTKDDVTNDVSTKDDVTVCGAGGSVRDASTRIKEGGGAW